MMLFHASFYAQPIDFLRPFSHYGTLAAALDRLFTQNKADRLLQPAWLYGARFDVSNFTDVGDVGWPGISAVAMMLHDYFKKIGDAAASEAAWKSVTSEAREAIRAVKDAGSDCSSHELTMLRKKSEHHEDLIAKKLTGLMQEGGIVGLSYRNDVEDAGKASYIPPFPVKPALSIRMTTGLDREEVAAKIRDELNSND